MKEDEKKLIVGLTENNMNVEITNLTNIEVLGILEYVKDMMLKKINDGK